LPRPSAAIPRSIHAKIRAKIRASSVTERVADPGLRFCPVR